MKKQLIIVGIIVILLAVGLSGCDEQVQNNHQTDNNNLKPVAECSSSINNGLAPLTVQFTGSGIDADGTIVSYYWDFDDGTTSTEQNPSHTFQTSGHYLVFLTVTDNNGLKDSAHVTIDVLITYPPTAKAYSNKDSGDAPLVVEFYGNGTDDDGYIISYHWNFGDGKTSSEQNPTHTFQNYGTYTVKLTVTDDKGATGYDSIIIKSQFPDPELVTHGSVKIGSSTRVFGIIKNVGKDDIEIYLPIVTLYDASNNYINSYYQSWASGIAPDIIKTEEKAFFCVQIDENWFDHYEIDITYSRTSGKPFSEKYGLKITDHFFEPSNLVLDECGGHVKNTGSSVVTNSFNVIGAFYDKSGSLVYVDVDTIYLSSYSSLYSGESKYFGFNLLIADPSFSKYDIKNYQLAIGPDY